MALIEYPDCGEPVSGKEKIPARWEHSREGGISSGEAGGKDAYRITKDESDTTVFFHSGSMDYVYLECSKCGRIHKFKKEYFDDIDASGCTSPIKIECPTCKAKARSQTKKGMAKDISAHAGNAGEAKLTRTGILIALAGMGIASLVPPLGAPLLLAGVAIVCVERFDKSRVAKEEIGASETLDAGGSHMAATLDTGSGSSIERKKITVPSREQSARRIASLLSTKVEKCSLEFTAAGYPEVLLNALTLGDFKVYGVPGDLVEITSESEHGGKALVCRTFRYNVLGWSAVSHGRKLEGRWDPFHKIAQSEMMFVRDGTTKFYFHSEKDVRCFKRFHKRRGKIVDRMTRAAADECARICATRHREMDTAVKITPQFSHPRCLPTLIITMFCCAGFALATP